MQKKLPISLVILILTFVFITPFAIINIDTVHDGILLKPAIDVAQGKILFRDTFTQYGALTTFIQAAAIKIFGEYLIVIRLTTALFYAIASVLLWHIWSEFLSKKLTLISLIFWLALAPFYDFYFHPWSSVYALVFQLMALLLLLSYCQRQSQKKLILIGLTTSLAFWCRQPVGILLFISIAVFLIFLRFFNRLSFRQAILAIFSLIFGFFLASLPFALYLFQNMALHDWWLQSFVLAKAWAQVVRGISLDQIVKSLFLARYWKTTIYWQQFYLTLIFILLPLNIVYLALKTKSIKLLVVCFVCLASWIQYYPLTDFSHAFWAATPMVGLFIYTFSKLFHWKTVFTIIIICLFIVRVVPGAIRFQKANEDTNKVPTLRYIKLTKQEKKIIETFSMQLSKRLAKNRTYINDSGDAFVSLLQPQSFHTFKPLYFYWEWFSSGPFQQDYFLKRQKYVQSNRPLIVTPHGKEFKNYCPAGNIYFFDRKVYLYYFCEK